MSFKILNSCYLSLHHFFDWYTKGKTLVGTREYNVTHRDKRYGPMAFCTKSSPLHYSLLVYSSSSPLLPLPEHSSLATSPKYSFLVPAQLFPTNFPTASRPDLNLSAKPHPLSTPPYYLNNQHSPFFQHINSCLINYLRHFHQFSD